MLRSINLHQRSKMIVKVIAIGALMAKARTANARLERFGHDISEPARLGVIVERGKGLEAGNAGLCFGPAGVEPVADFGKLLEGRRRRIGIEIAGRLRRADRRPAFVAAISGRTVGDGKDQQIKRDRRVDCEIGGQNVAALY